MFIKMIHATPYQNFQTAVARYTADARGVIAEVAVEDISSMLGDGCNFVTSALVNHQSGVGGAYTFLSDDNNNFVFFTGATPVTPVVPVGFKAGYVCGFIQGGGGQVEPDFSAVTLIANPHGFTKTFGQGSIMSILAVADDVFVLIGDGA